jgi:hypothetical protein
LREAAQSRGRSGFLATRWAQRAVDGAENPAQKAAMRRDLFLLLPGHRARGFGAARASALGLMAGAFPGRAVVTPVMLAPILSRHIR